MDLSAILDAVPGARDAVRYLTTRVADFQRLPAKLDALERRVAQMKLLFDQRQKPLPAGRAAMLLRDISRLRADYNQTAAGVADILDAMNKAGLLAGVDVNLLWNSAKTAATVAGALTSYDSVAKEADSLARTELSANDLQALGPKPDWGSGLLLYVLLAIGGYGLLRRRGRRNLW